MPTLRRAPTVSWSIRYILILGFGQAPWPGRRQRQRGCDLSVPAGQDDVQRPRGRMQRRGELQLESACRWVVNADPGHVPAVRVVPGPPGERLPGPELPRLGRPAPGEDEEGGVAFTGRPAAQHEPGSVDLPQ